MAAFGSDYRNELTSAQQWDALMRQAPIWNVGYDTNVGVSYGTGTASTVGPVTGIVIKTAGWDADIPESNLAWLTRRVDELRVRL